MKNKHRFKSLDRIEYALEYFQELLARISSTLLMVGLVVSMMNFLMEDRVFHQAPWTEGLWALFQALAVDANLSVVFSLLIEARQNKQTLLVVLYAILGVLLFFVAVLVTNTEALRQALGLKLTSAYDMTHIPVWILTLVRSVVAVGLVAASGISARLRINWQSQEQPTQAVDDVQVVEEEPTTVVPALLENPQPPIAIAAPRQPATSSAREKIAAHLEKFPQQAKVEEIMAATGLSRSTVMRYNPNKKSQRRHAVPATTTT